MVEGEKAPKMIWTPKNRQKSKSAMKKAIGKGMQMLSSSIKNPHMNFMHRWNENLANEIGEKLEQKIIHTNT